MAYVDGNVVAVPTAGKAAYVDYAKRLNGIFKEAGALSVADCWGDDVPEGKLTSFPMAVKCEPHETVVFSWIMWPSKAVRDAAWAKLMKLPEMQPGASPMPFDGKRMIYGGFEVMLEL